MIDFKKIDKSWTLFLDRDGVINDERRGFYINTWDEFKFSEGVKDALKIFAEKFGRIFIVTNQRGVAKGITKLHHLEDIHTNLLKEVEEAEGRIDKIYFSVDMEDDSHHRKPNPGMGLQAKKDFPEIEFSKSVMIGDKLSDMGFGKNLGVACTIFLPTTSPDVKIPNELIDLVFPDLISVARVLY